MIWPRLFQTVIVDGESALLESTWLPVSTDCIGWPVKVFQNLFGKSLFIGRKIQSLFETMHLSVKAHDKRSILRPDVSISSAAPAGKKTMVVRRPGDGFHSSQVFSVPWEEEIWLGETVEYPNLESTF